VQNNKQEVRRLNVAIGWIGVFVLLDQVSKWLAITNLSDQTFTFIPNFLSLNLVYNTGMAFGLLANGRILFLVISVIALIVGWKYYKAYFQKSPWFYWGGILFFAGTLGNFLDRLLYGKVTDFIAVHLGPYPFPIFNFADTFLCVSVAIALVAILFEEKAWKDER